MDDQIDCARVSLYYNAHIQMLPRSTPWFFQAETKNCMMRLMSFVCPGQMGGDLCFKYASISLRLLCSFFVLGELCRKCLLSTHRAQACTDVPHVLSNAPQIDFPSDISLFSRNLVCPSWAAMMWKNYALTNFILTIAIPLCFCLPLSTSMIVKGRAPDLLVLFISQHGSSRCPCFCGS